jgi:hypothetical protein
MRTDLYVVLNHGRIVETGNHQSLMMKKGYYYDLVRQQQQEGGEERSHGQSLASGIYVKNMKTSIKIIRLLLLSCFFGSFKGTCIQEFSRVGRNGACIYF